MLVTFRGIGLLGGFRKAQGLFVFALGEPAFCRSTWTSHSSDTSMICFSPVTGLTAHPRIRPAEARADICRNSRRLRVRRAQGCLFPFYVSFHQAICCRQKTEHTVLED